jgi:hypothetical protein
MNGSVVAKQQQSDHLISRAGGGVLSGVVWCGERDDNLCNLITLHFNKTTMRMSHRSHTALELLRPRCCVLSPAKPARACHQSPLLSLSPQHHIAMALHSSHNR